MNTSQNGGNGTLGNAILKLGRKIAFLAKKKPAITKMWVRTNDLRSHVPSFEIKCRHCDSKMFLRFSEVYATRYITIAIRHALNVVEYKCPRCSLTQKFFVEDTPEYLREVLDMRDGVRLFIPPVDEWKSESEEIKQRLEILGYM